MTLVYFIIKWHLVTMEYSSVFDRLEVLTDLEVAFLLCLISREHCIIETDRSAIDDLEKELTLVLQHDALCRSWLITVRWLRMYLIFLTQVIFQYIIMYY